MKKLLLIAVVVAGASALVFAGRAGGFGQRGFANGPGWMHPGPGGFGQRGFANGPGWIAPGTRRQGTVRASVQFAGCRSPADDARRVGSDR